MIVLLTILLGVSVQEHGQPIYIAWDAMPEHDFVAYLGPEPGHYTKRCVIGPETQFGFYPTIIGQTYYIAVSAVRWEIEGPRSGEISTVATGPAIPAYQVVAQCDDLDITGTPQPALRAPGRPILKGDPGW